MDECTKQNKKAWEYNAYDFWVNQTGTPTEIAKKAVGNPRAMLKKYSNYFNDVKGLKIANICGSCGKKAIPLALLGAEVTVFDISEDNKRYAGETADAANVRIDYVVGDVMGIDLSLYMGYFDIVFMEGGVLHYFSDINRFMKMVNNLLNTNGRMICSDFHPINKVLDVLELGHQSMSYFSSEIMESEMPHARFYDDEERKNFPKCFLRKYTLSEIINSVIGNGFLLKSFEEHPAWTNPKFPGEFTILAVKAS